jgi:hypothetical protein
MSGFDEIGGHGASHDAESEKCDAHEESLAKNPILAA